MSWRARWEWQRGTLYVGIWRSDWGVWGFSRSYYDGLWGYAFGLGKLLHVAWGPLNES